MIDKASGGTGKVYFDSFIEMMKDWSDNHSTIRINEIKSINLWRKSWAKQPRVETLFDFVFDDIFYELNPKVLRKLDSMNREI